jgi:hypothetical protein
MAKAVDAILDALEHGGVRCLVAIPDPAFLELLVKAQARGLTIISPIMRQQAASWPRRRRV